MITALEDSINCIPCGNSLERSYAQHLKDTLGYSGTIDITNLAPIIIEECLTQLDKCLRQYTLLPFETPERHRQSLNKKAHDAKVAYNAHHAKAAKDAALLSRAIASLPSSAVYTLDEGAGSRLLQLSRGIESTMNCLNEALIKVNEAKNAVRDHQERYSNLTALYSRLLSSMGLDPLAFAIPTSPEGVSPAEERIAATDLLHQLHLDGKLRASANYIITKLHREERKTSRSGAW